MGLRSSKVSAQKVKREHGLSGEWATATRARQDPGGSTEAMQISCVLVSGFRRADVQVDPCD